MELSEKEKKSISKKGQKSNKLNLLIGFIFICIALGIIPLHIKKINRINDTWQETYSRVNNIITHTEQELKMKEVAINSINYSKRILVKYYFINLMNRVGLMFLLGLFSLGIYMKTRFYLNLINKLVSKGNLSSLDVFNRE